MFMTDHLPSVFNRAGSKSALLALMAILLMPGLTRATEPIEWRSGAEPVVLADGTDVSDALAAMDGRSDARHIIVQFSEPLGREQLAELEAHGLRMLTYIGSHAYFASLAPDGVDVTALARTASLIGVTGIERRWRLHPDLAAGIVPEWAVVPPVEPEKADAPLVIGLYVLFHPDVPLVPVGVNTALAYGAKVRSHLESVNGLVIELPFDAIAALADEDAVQWIEPPLPKLSELNDSNREITGANIVQAPPYNLDGSGVTVLVYDGGYGRASHNDFGGRLTVRDSSGMSDHSTHVACTIGGDGAASGGVRRGMAPGVAIEAYGFEVAGGLQEGFLYSDPGDLEADYGDAVNAHGADIANNSIGSNVESNGYSCSMQGQYGVTAALIDSIVRGSLGSPFRIVWAAGNERQGSRCNVEGFGDYYSTAPPGGGKNHITVGALNSNDDSVTSFTSWGPVNDGRLKPDISGPGCQSNGDGTVMSCSSSGDTDYTGKCGTSMAAPTVAGLAALLLQDFRAQYPSEPDFRNSTLKAFFAHTAVDVQNAGPDYQTGYGSVRIQPAIDLMRAGNFTEELISQGETYLALVLVSPGDPEMKVTLAWDDLAGTPNVNPSLVNDLDLIVRDPSGAVHHPWTLDPLNPSAPAVQNQADHLNNIEQVFAASPTPGAWQIEVSGFNVALGSQPFSLTVSPLLVNCSTEGLVTLDRLKYGCESVATLQIVDCDLNTDDGVVETISISIVSDAEPAGETVLLTETAAETAVFRGSILLSETDDAGTLRILEGDVITATYIDADDGSGNFDVTVEATATVDCQAPVVSNVQATGLEPRSAVVNFDVDEPAMGTVRYGTSCASLSGVASGSGFQTSHSISLGGLTDDTDYYFAVDVADEAGNAATDDNGGACYSFRTLDVPNFFTEQFGAFDLANWSILFTPDGSFDYYRGCGDAIEALPTDPTGGTNINLIDDDSSQISVASGESVSLYGTDYTSFYVGSNGYITFGSGDIDYNESLGEHFDRPRISGRYDDLDPSAGGSVSWLQLDDHVAVTYENVPDYSTSNSNTFQIELFFDGTIQISYMSMDAGDGIVGLSAGEGLSPDFLETDLSAQASCQVDCNENGIPDGDDIAGGTSEDCDRNHIPDECQIADGTSEDCNTNGIPDECDLTSGSSQDSNGNGIPDECEMEAPIVVARGARYLAVTPLGGFSQEPVALLVTGDPQDAAVACMSLYVQAGATSGLLDEAPVFQSPATWGTVFVYGEAVIPVTSYTVQAESANGVLSGGSSATTWQWGDVDNNGSTGFLDILLMVHGFKDDFSGATLEAMDQEPCIPDRAIGFLDMLDGVEAFKDKPFTAKGCSATCP